MAQRSQIRSFDQVENEAQRIFKVQKEAYAREPYLSYEKRKELLTQVEKILIENADVIAEAVNADYGCRSALDTKMYEIFSCVDTLRHAKKHVRKWMKPQRRHVSLLYATGKNRLIVQPKGVVGIVSPWNYPIFLAISPLANALAAGNRCMIKLAANSSNVCAVLNEKFREQISEEHIAILPGVKPQEFSTLPFDHMCFTGSADAGRSVMQSAAENLTPVTLELGGKSPTIVCDDFDLKTAAERILFGKFINAGQTCLAPDYLFLPEGKTQEFVRLAKQILTQRFPDITDGSYTSVIDQKAFDRITATMHDARDKGAELVSLVQGAEIDESIQRIPPHLVVNTTDDMRVMREEIFGPLFPIKTYKTLDEVIEYVGARDRPLGLYLFTHNKATQEKMLYSTISGGVTINNCIYHVTQHDMPFGGTGASGMGHYHGYEGFLEFSKMRGVFYNPKISALHLFYPPYTQFHLRIYDLLIKFFK